VKASWRCSGCGRSIPSGEVLRCPDCELPARLAEGQEILLDRIELEVP
jgi:hydrogenase nickel incorporation protein HypA/HybF